MMFAVLTATLLIAMTLVLSRALSGPGLFDRLLAANAFGTLIILFIAAYGFLSGRPDFLDLAIVYALINYITTVALLKFFNPESSGSTSCLEDDI